MRIRFLLFFVSILVSDYSLASNQSIQKNEKNSFGVGLGLSYGVVGFSYDRVLSKKYTLTIAYGAAPFLDGNIFNIGAKYHLLDHASVWHPRVTLLFGKNAWGNYRCRVDRMGCGLFEVESYLGFTLGGGQAWVLGASKKHIIDFDVMLRLYSFELEDARSAAITAGAEVDESTYRLSFSLGYRYRF